MNKEIKSYNAALAKEDKKIANLLAEEIEVAFGKIEAAESKVWHKHPVWFIAGNPIVGYSKQKAGIRLMFWSGVDFEEKKLDVVGEKFKDASIFYTNAADIKAADLKRWFKKGIQIQWDYKNIVKRKGELIRLL